MPVDDRLREPGRAGAVEDPERVVEGDVCEGKRLVVPLGRERLPGRRRPERPERGIRVEVGQDDRPLEAGHRVLQRPDDVEPVVVAPAVAVAVDGEQEARLDLREAVDDAARAEVRGAARPDRAEARARVEGDGGLEDVGDVRDDAVAGADPRAGERGGEAARQLLELTPRRLAQGPQLGRVTDGDRLGLPVAEDVLGVVEPRAGEPLRAGHRAAAEDALVRRRRPHVEELPDRAPEGLELAHRPPPEVVVPGRLHAVAVGEPARVARDRGALDARLVGSPENRWRAPHGESLCTVTGTSRLLRPRSGRLQGCAPPKAGIRAAGFDSCRILPGGKAVQRCR